MQSESVEDEPIEVTEAMLNPASSLSDRENAGAEAPTKADPARFHGDFEDYMELHADAQTVAKYLNAHQDWFCRCAQPMKAEPLGAHGYALTIGRFGAFGYQVVPKVGLELMPPEQGVYRIHTIPVPNYVAPGYDVDFNAAMHLVDAAADNSAGQSFLPPAITRVQWHLDLTVYIHFPKFIYKLSSSAIQTTGDRILCQIVRQVSRRLTYKVQQDFYTSSGIPFPHKPKKRS